MITVSAIKGTCGKVWSRPLYNEESITKSLARNVKTSGTNVVSYMVQKHFSPPMKEKCVVEKISTRPF